MSVGSNGERGVFFFGRIAWSTTSGLFDRQTESQSVLGRDWKIKGLRPTQDGHWSQDEGAKKDMPVLAVAVATYQQRRR
jgi:hypothetical protein